MNNQTGTIPNQREARNLKKAVSGGGIRLKVTIQALQEDETPGLHYIFGSPVVELELRQLQTAGNIIRRRLRVLKGESLSIQK